MFMNFYINLPVSDKKIIKKEKICNKIKIIKEFSGIKS